MSRDETDWRKTLGKEVADAEAQRLAEKTRSASEEATASLIGRESEIRFVAKVNKFIDTLRNRALYEMEEVNRHIGSAPRGNIVPKQINAFEVWRQFPLERLPEAYGKPELPPLHKTVVLLDVDSKTLVVRHPEIMGKEERFVVEEDPTSDLLIIKDRKEVLSTEGLIRRILEPIFRIGSATR